MWNKKSGNFAIFCNDPSKYEWGVEKRVLVLPLLLLFVSSQGSSIVPYEEVSLSAELSHEIQPAHPSSISSVVRKMLELGTSGGKNIIANNDYWILFFPKV